MRVLVLGGTSFLGRAIVSSALRHGHEVSIFNRGVTNPSLFGDGVERLRGDRETGEVEALGGRSFDAVIDVAAYVPRVVRQAVAALGDVAHYTFISTCSVYDETVVPEGAPDESHPLWEFEDPGTEDVETYYGQLKASCERAVLEAFPATSMIVRPGYIMGPTDTSDRLLYWVRRSAEGGRMLAPGPTYPTQFLDVRDLGAWVVALVERRETGILNALGEPATFDGVLEVARRATHALPDVVFASDAQLTEIGATWENLPMWGEADGRPFAIFDDTRCVHAGLARRPWADTVRDTWIWDAIRDHPPLVAGMTHERERELLAALDRLA